MQKTSPAGRALIEAFEGCEKAIPGRPGFFTTYRDSVKVLTLGFGHTNLGGGTHIAEGDVWDQVKCDAELGEDLGRTEAEVLKIMAGVALSQPQFDALVSFHFNTGDLGKSSIPAKIKQGGFDAAMATLLLYDHAGGVRIAGLVRRREAEKLMFEGKVSDALRLAGAHIVSGDAAPKPAKLPPVPAPPLAPPLKPAPAVTPAPLPAPTAPAPHQASLLERINALIHAADYKIG